MTVEASRTRVGAAIGAHLGSPHPLLVPDGAQALWGWVSTPRAPGVAGADLAPLADQLPDVPSREAAREQFRLSTQQMVIALRPDVERAVEKLFGRTLFLYRPTPKRLKAWRAKASRPLKGSSRSRILAVFGRTENSAMIRLVLRRFPVDNLP